MTFKSACLAVVGTLVLTSAAPGAEPVRVMTFNIRYGTAPDGENAWPHRRELVAKVIEDFGPDILGLQEALRSQLDEISEALPKYSKVGVGRDADGGGEYSAILYNARRFDLADAGTFWLSDTPKKPGSRTWGNNLPRICTWARLVDRGSGQRLLAINTHWDHQSQPARVKSGELMATRIQRLSERNKPLVVTGDFNATPDNPAIAALVKGGELRDSLSVMHPEEHDTGTFNGFGRVRTPAKIDAVLVSEGWSVKDAAIVRTHEGERYPSDHFPVTAVVEFTADAAK